MKLRELVCQNCGADIHPKLGDKKIICEYCGSEYVIDEDNVSPEEIINNINNFVSPSFKGIFMFVFSFIFISAISTILIVTFSVFKSTSEYKYKTTTKEVTTKVTPEDFNSVYENQVGVNDKMSLINLLSNVLIEKKNIKVNYNNKVYKSSKEITQLITKVQTSKTTYNVSYEYDSDGYINKINIENIK